jgi:photosystem II stability/assembly factor-like uncharacterized protein
MRRLIAGLAFLALQFTPALAQNPVAQNPVAEILPSPARQWANPSNLVMFDLARAGDRIIGVGEHGMVVLSDDDGQHFRQATSVPVDSALTAVFFTDSHNGWAVGHWGVIIATKDGGETWQTQRLDSTVDQPLFSLVFKNDQEGWAVGLWSVLLHTEDGGKIWNAEHLQVPPGSKKADSNLYKVFLDDKSTIYIAAEQGRVLRSTDGGKNWVYLNTGYQGSLWTGIADSNGNLFVGGLRGNLFRSIDSGTSWTAFDSGSKASITDLIEVDGQLLARQSLERLIDIDRGFPCIRFCDS